MKFSRSSFLVVLVSIMLLVQACDENNELFEDPYPVYENDLLNFEGITETDETGKKIGDIDQGDWLELSFERLFGSSSKYPWFWCIEDIYCEYSSGKVHINWTTPSESDFLFWDIFRSDDNNINNAEIINEEHIVACGNMSEPTDYVYIDENITTNEAYSYWLGLSKADSTNHFWGPMPLVIIPSLSFGPAYPNPAEDQAIIPILLSEEKGIAMYVINETGDLLDVLVDENLGSGLHNILWNASDKENGLYRVIFHCENDTLHQYGDILIERE